MNGLYAILTVLIAGNIGLGLVGVAVHHGWLGAQAAFGVALVNAFVRVWWPARDQLRISEKGRSLPPPPKGTRRRLFRRSFKLIAHALFVMVLGYGWAHVLYPLPATLRIATGAVLVVCLVWFAWQRSVLLLRSLTEWPLLNTRAHPPRLTHLLWVTLAPFWAAPDTTFEQVLEHPHHGIQFAASSVRWLDPPYRGIRTAFTSGRAMVLGRHGDAPNDVYLVHVRFSHDGHVSRVGDVYNLSGTTAVDEGNIVTWRKWALWTVLEGTALDIAPHEALPHDANLPENEASPLGLIRSIEIADLRGEPEGLGDEWTRLTRFQRAISNWQLFGQFRGVGRSQLTLDVPSAVSHLHIDVDGLTAAVTPPGGVTTVLHLELGKTPSAEALGGVAGYRSNETPLPSTLVPWMVDRLRDVSWIGSDGMQWIKGWAFRAEERLEDLEHAVVGIDADEEIAEQIGSSLEGLPVAIAGPIPGWPPAPMEPVFRDRLTAEGQWVSVAADLMPSAPPGMPSPFVFSFIRSDPDRSYVQTSVVLWDPRRVELHMVAGTEEPKSATGELGTGQIPRDPDVLQNVVATFNGAFQAVHGQFGMMENRHVQLPPKPYAATVATYDDGSAGFGTWPESPGVPEIPSDMVGFRQNLTALVLDLKYNPYQREWWGGVPEGWTEETRTVRSGLCLTEEGYIGYFYSLGITPQGLGRAMRAARCVYGIHLDMNAGHAGFEFYHVSEADKLPNLGRPLDNMWEAKGQVQGLRGYEFLSRLLVRKMPLMGFPRYLNVNARDFFYLTRRALLPGNDLAPLNPAHPDDGKWKIVDTGTHVWPPAAAFAQFHAPGKPATGAKPYYTVTRLDPKQLRPAGDAASANLGLVPVTAPQALPFEITPDGQVRTNDAPPTLTPTGCIDKDGMLVLLEPPTNVASDEAGLLALLTHLSCVTPLPDVGVVRVVLPHLMHKAQPVSSAPATSAAPPASASSSGLAVPHFAPNTLWLTHQALTGAKRVFTDTPVLPPTKWAYVQARPVPFGPSSVTPPKPAAPPTRPAGARHSLTEPSGPIPTGSVAVPPRGSAPLSAPQVSQTPIPHAPLRSEAPGVTPPLSASRVVSPPAVSFVAPATPASVVRPVQTAPAQSAP